MRIVIVLCLLLPLSGGEESPAAHRAAAIASARLGNWRSAETHQRRALELCPNCAPEDRALLRSELATYLVLAGFPEAAAPLWRRSIAELPPASAHIATQYIGLGVALHAGGHTAEANAAWQKACRAANGDKFEDAACRFNIAVVRADWSELESLLPTLLTVPGALTRATALLQTANAAITAGHPARARLLLDQADAVIVWELSEKHPFRASVYDARAHLAEAAGDAKEAKQWRRKAQKENGAERYPRGTVSLEELKRRPQ